LEHLTQAKRAQILAVDARDVTDVRHEVDRIRSQAAHAVVLVFTPAELEKQVGAALKGSSAFAVLPVPIDQRKTSATLEGATAEALAQKSAHGAKPALSVEPFVAQQSPKGSGSASEGKGANKRLMMVAGAVAALLATGGVLLLNLHSPTAAPTSRKEVSPRPGRGEAGPSDAALVAAPAAETSIVHGTVDDLLEKARDAMRERRYTEPTGNNALLYYRSALAADPANGEAIDGLQRVSAVLVTRFEEALSAGRIDEGALALANLKLASPQEPRLAGFELRLTTAQVAKALADGNVERAAALVRLAQQSSAIPAEQINKWRADIGRRQEDAKIQRLTNMVSDRIRDGRLLDPTEDSAKTYLAQLREAAPTYSGTQRLTRELNIAYLRKARESALARAPDADRWLSEAKAGGATTTELTAFQRDLTAARQRSAAAESDRLAQLARERIRDGRLTDPAQDSAAYYLGQLQAADATYPGLAPISRDLGSKLLERARNEAQAGSASQLEADLLQAKRFGADAKEILAIQLQSASAASAGNARGTGTSSAPTGAQLKRLRYVPPEYPRKALEQQIEGAVTIQFTVDTRGDPKDLQVVEASPRNVFDRATLDAVKRWHYQPSFANGQPVEVPVRMTIRFQVPK
jgi:TonB family protein